jgi:hypothetical protein
MNKSPANIQKHIQLSGISVFTTGVYINLQVMFQLKICRFHFFFKSKYINRPRHKQYLIGQGSKPIQKARHHKTEKEGQVTAEQEGDRKKKP